MEQLAGVKVLFIAGFGPIVRDATAVAGSTTSSSESISRRRVGVTFIRRH